jgi:hypothetical protein
LAAAGRADRSSQVAAAEFQTKEGTQVSGPRLRGRKQVASCGERLRRGETVDSRHAAVVSGVGLNASLPSAPRLLPDDLQFVNSARRLRALPRLVMTAG